MKQSFFTFCFLSILVWSCISGYKKVQEKERFPNIIYILCDDLGYGDIKSYSPEYCAFPTPNVDKIASEGMMFTNAHSGASVCTPTRYGLLTGRYSWRTRLQKGVVKGNDDPLIDQDRLTVAGFLKSHGFHTGMVGKWHLNFNYIDPQTKKKLEFNKKDKNALAPIGAIVPDGPITRGFDYYYGYHHSGTMSCVVENNQVIKHIKPVQMLSFLAGKSVEYIEYIANEDKNGNPFFLYVALNSPHTPIVPSEEWQGKSGVGKYGDFVMETDWVVGEIMKALDKNNLAENTLIIFSSDNGASPASNIKKLNQNGHYPNAYLRGTKADVWDGGHRVPFIIRWPGKVKPGTLNDQLICHIDFMATCAEILGNELPENTSEDGISFFPALFGKPLSDEREAVVHHSIYGKFAIRKGKWKLCFCSGSGGWSNPKDTKASESGLPKMQLYNMETDIEEKNNVYKEYPEIVEELISLLEEYVANGRSTKGDKLDNDVTVDIWKESLK